MKKPIWILIVVIAVLTIGLGVFLAYRPSVRAPSPAVFDPANTIYTIDGTPVTLVNGKASVPVAPGSAASVMTRLFGTPTSGDLNGDGTPDAAVILVRDSGGSGTFYYVAAAVNIGNGAVGTNAVLLGDRVAPQTLEIRSGEIIANYADRAPGEPMTAMPSVGVSKYFTVIAGGNGYTLQETAPGTASSSF